VENLREANDLDVETWLALQRRRWRCPSCARPFSWYEARCHACGARLHSYGDGVPAKR
jgi:predicted amidophosphoribosyltransferase